VARASGPTCSLGTTYLAGYQKSAIPPTGGEASAKITDVGDQLFTEPGKNPTSHIAGYVGVEDTSGSHWMKAGIYNDPGHGRILWIDYNTDTTGHQFVDEAVANTGQSYTATITKFADGEWFAQIGSFQIDAIPLNGMTTTKFVGASFTQDTACNDMNFGFASVSPWTTGNMTKLPGTPYVVGNISSTGWNSLGGS
jgi:hypothetical protein